MKHKMHLGAGMLLAVLAFSACKKTGTTLPEDVQGTTVTKESIAAAPAVARHVAIGPVSGGTPYYVYSGIPGNYFAFNGILGNNIIRNIAFPNNPLPNVTGLAVQINAAAFCLSRPGAGTNWQIWKFPIGDPNSASLYTTILGTATLSLSDLELDPSTGYTNFLLLSRTNNRLCNVPNTGPTTSISAAGNLAPLINVSGVAVVSGTPFVLAQNGTTGHLMKCTPTLVPGWTLACATYTPPAVPFAFIESGCFFETQSSLFVVGSSAGGSNWTLTIPACGPGAAVPPAWVAGTKLIDFAAIQ